MRRKIIYIVIGSLVFITVLVSAISSDPASKNVSLIENENTAERMESQDPAVPELTAEARSNGMVNSPSAQQIQPSDQTTQNQNTAEQTTSQYTYYSITSVVDGDTVKININGTVETFRLIGMDTPETVDPRKPVQCFGVEASNKAKELLSGKKVRIEIDPTQGERDKYDRLLAYIHREDGLFYNKYMIEQGYAHEYTYNTPYKYQTEFKTAQKTAQASQLGLWSSNTCNGDTTSSSNQTAPATIPSSGKYYTSSYYTAKYYYPESCDGWKSLSTKYLKSYNTVEELLVVYPSKTKSSQCQ